MMGLGLEMQDGDLQFSNYFLYKFRISVRAINSSSYTLYAS